MKRLTLAAIFTLLCLPAFGQTVTGTITSGDAIWFLTTGDNKSKSGWSGDQTTAIVTLFGHANPDTIKDFQGALTIQFYLFEAEGAQFVNEVDIVYYEDAAKGAFVTQGHGDGSIISLETVELDGNMMTLKGKFNVTLLFTDDFGVTLNKDHSRQINGGFDVRLVHDQR